MRTSGSPNTPCTAAFGRQAGKRYTSTNRRTVPIANSCQVFEPLKTLQTPAPEDFQQLGAENSSTRFQEDPFKLTDETIIVLGATLHRIEALVSFGDVSARQKGGFLEKEANLSHEHNAWVSGNAQVMGNARVEGNAQVSGNAQIYRDAIVSGSAHIMGNARVSDKAQVTGNAQVDRCAWVYQNAQVSEKVQVFGTARVMGNAQVMGDAQVSGNAWVYGSLECKTGHYFASKSRRSAMKEFELDDDWVVLWMETDTES